MELSSRPCTLGAEARDILMGQLFGVAALVRAMAARMAAGEMSSADAITFGAVVAEEVSTLASSKTYLAESASAVVLELASALGREPGGRGLHSSTPQLNLSRFGH